MLDVAEVKLPKTKEDGKKELIVWVNAVDDSTKGLFTSGYVRSKFLAEHMCCCSISTTLNAALSAPIPDSTTPSRYSVRALGDKEELPARNWLSWKAFHPDEHDEKHQGWEQKSSAQMDSNLVKVNGTWIAHLRAH